VPRIISLTLAIHKSFPRENKPTTRYPLYRTSSAPTTSYPVQFPLTHGGGKSLGAGASASSQNTYGFEWSQQINWPANNVVKIFLTDLL